MTTELMIVVLMVIAFIGLIVSLETKAAKADTEKEDIVSAVEQTFKY